MKAGRHRRRRVGSRVYPLALDGDGIKTLPFLSDEHIDALRFTAAKARELGMRVDLTVGSGWSFGGPQVPISEASGKLRVERVRVDGERSPPADARHHDRRETAGRVLGPREGRCDCDGQFPRGDRSEGRHRLASRRTRRAARGGVLHCQPHGRAGESPRRRGRGLRAGPLRSRRPRPTT